MTLDAVGGVWRYALDLAEGLGEAGIDVLLVGFGPKPSPDRLREIERFGRASLVWVDESLDWMVSDATALTGVAPALQRLAADWRPDLIHLNLPSQAVGLQVSCPVVAATHSCLATWWQAVCGGAPLPAEWLWQRCLTGEGLAQAARVLAPSASHAAATRTAYGDVASIDVVHNASLAVCPPTRQRKPVVLSAGRWWDEGKGAATLDAAAALSPWPVLMAGGLDGPDSLCPQPAHALALGDLAPATLTTLMERAAVFTSPSLYEPFGLAVLEAAQRGAALVLSDIPTFRELWRGAALFVPPGDPAALAAVITRLAGDEGERAHLAGAALRRAADFSPERQIEGVLRCYGAALGASVSTLAAAE
ncbi:glycosyltransferase family 4 protein [Bosea sp. OAE506]|uniref:glycosyltransferase family 4 protein n=1 Tax=Bosea sp. OAE506 TaxID=2663870 RepID=UPI00178A1D8E